MFFDNHIKSNDFVLLTLYSHSPLTLSHPISPSLSYQSFTKIHDLLTYLVIYLVYPGPPVWPLDWGYPLEFGGVKNGSKIKVSVPHHNLQSTTTTKLQCERLLMLSLPMSNYSGPQSCFIPIFNHSSELQWQHMDLKGLSVHFQTKHLYFFFQGTESL